MKQFLFLAFLTSISISGQTENKIDGIVVNTPCKLEFARTINGITNYTCTIQKGDEKIINYSVSVESMASRMANLSASGITDFKNTYYTVVKNSAESNNETTEYITLGGNLKALKSNGTINYQGQTIYTSTITFLKDKKSYMVNVLTNIKDPAIRNNLASKIKL